MQQLQLYSQRVNRFLRDLQQHVAARGLAYRNAAAAKPAPPAVPAPSTLAPGDMAMILRTCARKLTIPNSGPYQVVALHKHTVTLHNLATGATLQEHRSNVRAFKLGV